MDITHAISPEELLLAQLTTSKLAKVMHGLMSVGTACLEMESPTSFLAGRDKTPLGFLEVLRCIGVYSDHADVIPVLRQQVHQLSDLTSRYHALFLELAHWRTMSCEDVAATVDRLNDCYTQFSQRLEEFASLLGMESNYSEQARQDVRILEAFFQVLPAH